MKMLMIKMMMINSINMTMMKTPMSMMMMSLMMQSMLMSVLMNEMSNNSWIPLITFLVMVGGLLVIFMYMTSITSNQKFNLSVKMIIMNLLMILTINLKNTNTNANDMMFNLLDFNMVNMFYTTNMILTMYLMSHLMLTMLTINSMMKNNEGPLRSKNYE